MVKGYENKKLQLNADLGGRKKGSTINIRVDSEGTPLDRYWRDRIKDAKSDKCVEFVEKDVVKEKATSTSNFKKKEK